MAGVEATQRQGDYRAGHDGGLVADVTLKGKVVVRSDVRTAGTKRYAEVMSRMYNDSKMVEEYVCGARYRLRNVRKMNEEKYI